MLTKKKPYGFLCDICEARHKSNQTVKWCPECEEKLCVECHGNHSVSKVTRIHSVVDIKHFRKLPRSLSDVKLF